MAQIIIIIIVLIILISILIRYESMYSDLTYVISTVDKKPYLVRNRVDKQEAADMLATIKQNLTKIVNYLEENNMSDPKVKRLVEKFKPENISESMANNNYTSYSVNKGEKIVFCIRAKDENQTFETINTMMFVAIHELAHIMTLSIGHTEEFWDNMRYLLEKAIKISLYTKVDYKNQPQDYCGTKITDSPLEQSK